MLKFRRRHGRNTRKAVSGDARGRASALWGFLEGHFPEKTDCAFLSGDIFPTSFIETVSGLLSPWPLDRGIPLRCCRLPSKGGVPSGVGSKGRL